MKQYFCENILEPSIQPIWQNTNVPGVNHARYYTIDGLISKINTLLCRKAQLSIHSAELTDLYFTPEKTKPMSVITS